MITGIKGKIIEKNPAYVVIETSGGLDYWVNISLATYTKIREADEVHLFTHFVIKEDEHQLFGFFDEEERTFFRLLITVNGIGVNTARLILSSMSVHELHNAIVITADWLQKEATNKYDGFFCSNVIDVVPEEIASNILKEASRVVKPGSNLIISLNFYLDTNKPSRRPFEIKNNNYIYLEGILRMVARKDEEWSSIFSEYFNVEKLVHFSWPGEVAETRRLFYLKNSK